jgi:hypothetical protein
MARQLNKPESDSIKPGGEQRPGEKYWIGKLKIKIRARPFKNKSDTSDLGSGYLDENVRQHKEQVPRYKQISKEQSCSRTYPTNTQTRAETSSSLDLVKMVTEKTK